MSRRPTSRAKSAAGSVNVPEVTRLTAGGAVRGDDPVELAHDLHTHLQDLRGDRAGDADGRHHVLQGLSRGGNQRADQPGLELAGVRRGDRRRLRGLGVGVGLERVLGHDVEVAVELLGCEVAHGPLHTNSVSLTFQSAFRRASFVRLSRTTRGFDPAVRHRMARIERKSLATSPLKATALKARPKGDNVSKMGRREDDFVGNRHGLLDGAARRRVGRGRGAAPLAGQSGFWHCQRQYKLARPVVGPPPAFRLSPRNRP